jgi:hypothetical protein
LSTIDFSVRRRDLAWMIALILLLSAVWVFRSDTAVGGGGPPGEGIDVVYITVGTNFPDALGVGPGAALNGAPIILVPTNPPLDPFTITELSRLDPRKVVIVGGTSAVSLSMEQTLVALLPNATFERLAGSNRYATNTLLTQAVYPMEAWASLGALAFGSGNPDVDDVNFFLGGEANGANVNGGTLYAVIQLPDGATIIELQSMGFESSNTEQVEATLYQVDNTGGLDEIASIGSGASAQPNAFVVGTTSITPAFEVVDNGTYTYLVGLSGVQSGRLTYGVRVKYRLGTPGA